MNEIIWQENSERMWVTMTNRLNQEEIDVVKLEITEAAKSLLKGSQPFLEDVRRLASMRFRSQEMERDEDLLLFAAIASEADHIPDGHVRPLCSATWLANCDEQTRKLERIYAAQVTSACERIIARFSCST